MKYIHDIIREHFYKNLNLNVDGSIKNKDKLNIEELKKTEWNKEFEQLMRNRLIIGAFRYGKMNAPDKPNYDRMSSIIKRANNYLDTGNDELLVDIANLCMMEYIEGNHINKHFSSVDDGEHVKIN